MDDFPFFEVSVVLRSEEWHDYLTHWFLITFVALQLLPRAIRPSARFLIASTLALYHLTPLLPDLFSFDHPHPIRVRLPNPAYTPLRIDGPPQTQDVDIPFHGRPLVVDITQEVLGEFRKAIQLIDKVVFNTSGPLLRPWYGDIDMVNNFAFSVRLACESLPPKMLFLESSDGSQLSDQLSKWYLDMNDWVLEFHTMKQELRESPYHWPKETYTTVVGLLYSFDEVMGNLENEALNHWYLYNTTHVAAGRVARALLTDRPIVRPTAVANPWLWIRILRESSLSPLIQRLKELDEFFQFNVLPIIDSCLSVIEGNETSTSDHPCQKPKWRTYMSKYMIKHAGEMRKGHERLTQLLEELEHVDSLFLDVQLMLDPVLWKLEGIRDGYETFGDEYHQKTGWQGRYWIELDVREVVYWFWRTGTATAKKARKAHLDFRYNTDPFDRLGRPVGTIDPPRRPRPRPAERWSWMPRRPWWL